MPNDVIHGPISSNPLINGLLWDGWHWDFGSGARTISYLLASDTGIGWTTEETASYYRALSNWSFVTDVHVAPAASALDATFIENISTADQMINMSGSSSVIAFHDVPQDGFQAHSQFIDLTHTANYAVGQAGGFYNQQSLAQLDGWSNAQLVDGSYFQMVFVHELGHAMGLKHPFDAFGNVPTFPGVPFGNPYQLGTNNQNHQFWTAMAYNSSYGFDGNGHINFLSGNPSAFSLEYGYIKGPMAYDIAAVQYLYGANNSAALGDTIYDLPDADIAGTGWTCIWDSGGNDTLRYNGTKNVILDLTAATLDGSVTGGGVLSYAAYVHGGFTIANGVVIENAIGGSGNDVIVGNQANSNLYGGGGNDTISGGGGNDVLFGMDGNDTLEGGSANASGYNQIWGGTGNDTASYSNTTDIVYADLTATGGYVNFGAGYVLTDSYNSIENLVGGSNSDTLVGDGAVNVLSGGIGNDVLFGLGGNDTLIGGTSSAGYNQLWGGSGSDTASYVGQTGAVYADLFNFCGYIDDGAGYVLTDTYNSIENLSGGSGNDVLVGDGSSNVIAGASGADQLYGRGGADFFVYTAYGDSNLVSGYDTIADFQVGVDKIDLTAFHTTSLHLIISIGAGSDSVYLESIPGVFNSATDLAIALIGVNALNFSDFLF
jgi:Ca2+-binding RTX toxin-like protein